MLTTNPAYDAKRQSMAQAPIYIIEIAWNAGQPGTENLNDVYFSTADVTKMGAVPTWLSSRLYPVLDHNSISALTEKIDEKNGTSSIGTLSFNLIDKDGKVTDVFNRAEADTGQSIRRQRVELYIMYEGMNWADKIKWRSLNIYDAQYDDSKDEYKITAQSILKWMKKDVFTPYTTTLQAAVTSTAAPPFNLMAADRTQFVRAVEHSSFGTGKYGFIKINDEIMMWDTGTATSFHIVARALFGSTQQAHKIGDDITEVAVLKGNPMELALRVLLSTGTAASTYDVYPAHWGVGLATTDLDINEFIRVGGVLTGYDSAAATPLETGTPYELVYSDSVQAKVLIERELFRNIGAFGKILGDGRYSVQDFDYTAQPGLDPATGVVNANGVTLLDENNIIKWTQAKANMQQMSAIVDLQYNPVPRDTGKPIRRLVFRNDAAKARHGTEASIKVVNKGMLSDQTSVESAAVLFNAMQSRYVAPPVEMSVELLPEYHVIEVGDVVAVDLKDMRDVFYTHRKWAAATDYSNGDRLLTASGLLYVCSVAGGVGGTTGATEPLWGANVVTDNTVTWVKHDGHMSRLFEVTATSINLKNGTPKLSLMSQAEQPAWWNPTTTPGAASRYADSAYQRGTNLATLGWTSGVSPAGNISLGTLGTTTDYYFVGDITLSSTTNLTILGTVRIWCTGTISDQVGFTLNGRGNGAAGGLGASPDTVVNTIWYGSFSHIAGTSTNGWGSGGKGHGVISNGITLSPTKNGGVARGRGVYVHGGNPDATGVFRNILGVPRQVHGAGGGAGGAAQSIIDALYNTVKGGDGARGGASLCLIARNIDVTNGSYDLRGADAPTPVYGSAGYGVNSEATGGGGGGGSMILAVERGTLGGGAALYNPSKILIAGGVASNDVGLYTAPTGAVNNGSPGRVFSRSF